jgi:hypothetical protein
MAENILFESIVSLFVNSKKLQYEEAYTILNTWLEKCNNLRSSFNLIRKSNLN